jgi:hypothetical protein
MRFYTNLAVFVLAALTVSPAASAPTQNRYGNLLVEFKGRACRIPLGTLGILLTLMRNIALPCHLRTPRPGSVLIPLALLTYTIPHPVPPLPVPVPIPVSIPVPIPVSIPIPVPILVPMSHPLIPPLCSTRTRINAGVWRPQRLEWSLEQGNVSGIVLT